MSAPVNGPTWDDEPDDDGPPPEEEAPRRRKRFATRFQRPTVREAPAPLADFLRDPSLLPKRPPGR